MISLALVAVLSGSVQTEAHKPAPAALVKLSSLQLMACRSSAPNCRNPAPALAVPLYAIANADGTFTFPGLPDGSYTLEVTADASRASTYDFTIDKNDVRGVTITLHPRR